MTSTTREYRVRELDGSEAIDFEGRRRIPLGLIVTPLRSGRPIFVEGMRKSTAYYTRKRVQELLRKKIDVIPQRVDGISGYVFVVHLD